MERLDTATTVEEQFHAVLELRQSAIEHRQDIDLLLFYHGLWQRAALKTLPEVVERQVCLTLALVIKLAWLDGWPDEVKDEVCAGLCQGLEARTRFVLALVQELVYEFDGTATKSRLGMSKTDHATCRREFEKSWLPSLGGQTIELLMAEGQGIEAVLAVMETLFNWQEGEVFDFHTQLDDNDSPLEDSSYVPQEIPEELKVLLMHNLELSRLNSLLQWAFEKRQAVVLPLERIMIKLLRLQATAIETRKTHQAENQTVLQSVIQVAELLRRRSESHEDDGTLCQNVLEFAARFLKWFISCYPLEISPTTLQPLIHCTSQIVQLTRLHWEWMEVAQVGEEREQAFDVALMSVHSLLEQAEQLNWTVPQLTRLASETVLGYLLTRLKLAQHSVQSGELLQEQESGEDQDVVQYEDQLKAIATLARADLGPCLERLCQALEESEASLFHANKIVVQEQIHWLLLILGCTLTDPDVGEEPSLPDRMESYVKTQGSSVLIRLWSVVERLTEIWTKQGLELGGQVAITLMWFWKRVFLGGYLVLGEVGADLLTSRASSAVSTWILLGTSTKIETLLIQVISSATQLTRIFYSDPDVIRETTSTLEAIGRLREQGMIFDFPDLPTMLQQLIELVPHISEESIENTVRVVALFCSDFESEDLLQSLFAFCTNLIEAALVKSEAIRSFVQGLESARGILAGFRWRSSDTVEARILSCMSECSTDRAQEVFRSDEVHLPWWKLVLAFTQRAGYGITNSEHERLQSLYLTTLKWTLAYFPWNEADAFIRDQLATLLIMTLRELLVCWRERNDIVGQTSNRCDPFILTSLDSLKLFTMGVWQEIPEIANAFSRLLEVLTRDVIQHVARNVLLWTEVLRQLDGYIGHPLSDISTTCMKALVPLSEYVRSHHASLDRAVIESFEQFLRAFFLSTFTKALNREELAAMADSASTALLLFPDVFYRVAQLMVDSMQEAKAKTRLGESITALIGTMRQAASVSDRRASRESLAKIQRQIRVVRSLIVYR